MASQFDELVECLVLVFLPARIVEIFIEDDDSAGADSR